MSTEQWKASSGNGNPFNVPFAEFWENVELDCQWPRATLKQKIIWLLDAFMFTLMPSTWLRYHHPEIFEKKAKEK